MKRKSILAVDVMSEVMGKVSEEMRGHYEKAAADGYEISDQQATSLQNMYFAGIAKAQLDEYRDQGIRVTGTGRIRTMIDLSKMDLDTRRRNIYQGDDFNTPSISDDEFEDHSYGFHIEKGGLATAEDWAWDRMAPASRDANSDKFGLSEENAQAIVRKGFVTRDKSVEDILTGLPRKHRVEHQTYVLDVDETLQAAGITSMAGQYFQLKKLLEEEKDDPESQDVLRKMYSQIELDDLVSASGDEFDFGEELDD